MLAGTAASEPFDKALYLTQIGGNLDFLSPTSQEKICKPLDRWVVVFLFFITK